MQYDVGYVVEGLIKVIIDIIVEHYFIFDNLNITTSSLLNNKPKRTSSIQKKLEI